MGLGGLGVLGVWGFTVFGCLGFGVWFLGYKVEVFRRLGV